MTSISKQHTDIVNCTHHWLVEPPHGEELRAVCKKCGALRTFPASPEELYNHRAPLRVRKAGQKMNLMRPDA